MPWQRSGLTRPRTVQTVRNSACLRSLKSKHTAQTKAELPFQFDRWEEVPPPLWPPPPLPSRTDGEVLLHRALQQKPPSPLASRNPTFLRDLPRYTQEFLTAQLPYWPRAEPCPHHTHTAPAKSLQPTYTYIPTYTLTDTQARHSAWPNTPRKTQDCPLCPWAARFPPTLHPSLELHPHPGASGATSQGHPQGLFLPLLHDLIHALRCVTRRTPLHSPMLYLTLETVQFPQAHVCDEVVSFPTLLFMVPPHHLRSPPKLGLRNYSPFRAGPRVHF